MKKLALKEENREKYCNPPLEKRIKGAINNPIVKHLATCTGIGGLAGTGLMFLVPDKNFRKCMPGIGAGIGLALSGPTFQHKMAKWREKAKRTRELNKLKKKGLEKNGAFGTLALGAAGGHLVQGGATVELLKHPEYGIGQLATRALAAPGKGMKTIPGSIALGVAGGLIPEIEILNNHFHEFSKKLHENLLKRGITPKTMSRNDLLAIGHLLRGNFDKAYAHGSVNLQKAVQTAIADTNPNISNILQQIIDAKNSGAASTISKEQATAFLKDVQSATMKNKFFGPLINYFRRNPNELAHPYINKLYNAVGEDSLAGMALESLANKRKGSILRELANSQGESNVKLNKALTLASNAATSKGLLILEPGSGAVGEGKFFGATPLVKKVPKWLGGDYLVNAQKKLADIFVVNPTKKYFNKGLNGEVIYGNAIPTGVANPRFSKQNIREFIETLGFNPITASLKDFGNQFGLAARKAGLTQEDFGTAKNIVSNAKQLLAPKAPSEVAQNVSKRVEFVKPEATGAFSGMRDNLRAMFVGDNSNH